MAARTRSRSSAAKAPPRGGRDFASIATQYARDVVAKKIPACKLTVQACQRHLKDLAASKGRKFRFHFDEAKAARACRFIECLPHVDGEWAKRRELLRLEPWQVFIVVSIFGWVWKRDGRRRFRKAYIEVPRKNAKSTLAAAIAKYMAFADGEMGAQVFCGATSEKQAWKVFGPAKKMAQRTKALRDGLGIEVFAGAITQERTGSTLQPIIGKPGDGDSPHCAIVDEYHEHATSEQYDAMETGMHARRQPLIFVITTAGFDLGGPCYLMHLDLRKVLSGAEEDDEFFGIIYSLDDDDDWTQDSALWKANPNLGVSVLVDGLRSDHRNAIRNAHRSGKFRTKNLNQWVEARTPFFNVVAWKKGAVTLADERVPGERRRLELQDFAGKQCIVFLDLASKKDLAAAVAVFCEEVEGEGEDGKAVRVYSIVPRFWLPEARILAVKTAPYVAWRDQRWLEETPGDIIDFDQVGDYLRELKEIVEIREVVYDPFQATYLVTRMRAEGFPMVECGATVKNFSEPMKELDAAIIAGRVKHDGNPVMDWCIANVIAKLDKKDNVFPNKEPRGESKIDGAVAAIGAFGRWLAQEVEQESPSYHVRLRA